jgi:predicted phosphodiesterase
VATLKLQVLSDLHFEVNREFIPEIHPECDVLVLAGDIGIAGRGHLRTGLARVNDAIALTRKTSPRAASHVLFVPGNHEYDRQDWDIAHQEVRALCEASQVQFFDHGEIFIEGVRILGITFWCDFGLLGMDQLEKCMSSANRFLLTTGTTRFGAAMKADQVRDLALENRAWLASKLKETPPNVRATVVVTHFAPSGLSADPRYGLVPATASFCNDADELLSLANVWIHGHLHCVADYESRGCKVLSNPLGYAKKGEHAGFQAVRMISV